MRRTIKIVSWNVNSARARLPNLSELIEQQQPDVLCLQEVKSAARTFPFDHFNGLDYEVALHGEHSYNGVAILSPSPPEDVDRGLDGQARVIAATCQGTRVVNVYVPNGGSIDSDKHAYKLRWLDKLPEFLDEQRAAYGEFVLVGDFNVAPKLIDAAHPEVWEGTVAFDPKARAKLEALVQRYKLVDLHRKYAQGPGVFTWWDYRGDGFPRNDGLRIDFAFATPGIAALCTNAWVDVKERNSHRPSDHAPLLIGLLKNASGHPAT